MNTQKMICDAFGFKNVLEMDYYVYKTKIVNINLSELSQNAIDKIRKNKGKKQKIESAINNTFIQVVYKPSEIELEFREGISFNLKDKGVKSIDTINSESKDIELTAEEIEFILNKIDNKSKDAVLYYYDNKSLFSTTEVKKLKITKENVIPCALCGKTHTIGYTANNETELIQTIISDTYNECYAIQTSNFICEYCGYSLKAYGSPNKALLGKKMVNVLIHDGKAIEKSFNSDEKNDLYNILVNPPKPPFVIMINSRGTVLENLVFSSKATISKGLIIVNYGLNNLEVNPDEVFSSIEDAKRIAATYGIEVNSDSIWNRADEVSIQVKRTGKKGAIDLNSFYNDMGLFIDKYNRDCRLVAKMILNAYLKFHVIKDENVETVKAVSKNSNKSSLFDF